MAFVWLKHLWDCLLQQFIPMSRDCCMDHRYSPYYPFSERNNFIEHKISMIFQELEIIFRNYRYIQSQLLQIMIQFVNKAKHPELLQEFATRIFEWLPSGQRQLQQINPIIFIDDSMNHGYSLLSESNEFIEDDISMLFQELSMIFKYYRYIQNHLLQNMVQFIKAKQPELLQQLVTINFIGLPVKQNLLHCHCNPIAIQQRNPICRNCPMNHVCSPDYPFSERNSFIEHIISMLLKDLGIISRKYSYIRNYLLQNLVTFINEEKQSELLQVYKNNVSYLSMNPLAQILTY